MGDTLNTLPTEGDDYIYGTAGDDSVHGLGGNDTMIGAEGNDTMRGLEGNDMLLSSPGDDLLSGGDGNDIVSDHEGNNRLYGGNGMDTIEAGDQNDMLSGGADNDILFGGRGNDTMYGGYGNDIITGSGGNDILTGNSGADVFEFEHGLPGGFSQSWGIDTIRDFNPAEDKLSIWVPGGGLTGITISQSFFDTIIQHKSGDLIRLQNVNASDIDASNLILAPVVNTIEGATEGSDTLTGTNGDDIAHALGGNDVVNGLDGNDELHGNAGRDFLYGDGGNDTLYGGDGHDVLSLGDGNYTGTPNAGYDTYYQAAYGGNGNDFFENVAGGRNIFDGGDGHDEISFASYNGSVVVDLITWVAFSGSDMLHLVKNIESVSGSGVGNDTLVGDRNDNVLRGNGGDDILWGDAGNDVFVFNHYWDHDRIDDFNLTDDKMSFEMFGTALTYSDLVFTQEDNNTVITADVSSSSIAGNSITLLNIDANDLGQEHFMFFGS